MMAISATPVAGTRRSSCGRGPDAAPQGVRPATSVPSIRWPTWPFPTTPVARTRSAQVARGVSALPQSGPEHANTLLAMNSLANSYDDAGRRDRPQAARGRWRCAVCSDRALRLYQSARPGVFLYVAGRRTGSQAAGGGGGSPQKGERSRASRHALGDEQPSKFLLRRRPPGRGN